ncbi:hypothetical protein NMG60_11019460 [Bertholletia excelsa]
MTGVDIAVLPLCSVTAASTAVHGIGQGPQEVEKWFQKYRHKKENLTKLRSYFHDTMSGKDPAAVRVAEAENTAQFPTLFGAVYVIDDLLTAGPEPNSTHVGWAQRLYAFAGQEDACLLMTVKLEFSSGEFNGGGLSVRGRIPVLEHYREMPIVGGSAFFVLARGTATAQTRWLNFTTGDAVGEWHVIAIHY